MTVLAMLENGRLRTQDENGRVTEIGPEHPDYQRLAAAFRASIRPSARSRVYGGVFILVGVATGWFVWRQLAAEGSYDDRLSVVGPLAIPFGLLFMFKPQWAGPWRNDTPMAQKIGIGMTLAATAAVFGINYWFMQNYRP